jgi:histidine kinase
VADSSRRIVDGRYAERVTVPTNSGQAMAQLVISFNLMAAALEQTEQQRVALLSNVSHELRTPLTGLRGYLEGMLDGLFPANEETFAWMSKEVARLHRLVDDIQNLSSIEAGQFALNLQEFELTAVLQHIINELKPQAHSKSLDLTLAPHTTLITVLADTDRTTQILINLIGNAIRYTPDGGRILLDVQVNGRNANIHIQDTGIGIPPESLPYVFERFYRVDPSRARKSGGSGIGLTISRHLAWAMGGELNVTSPGVGQGATFTLTLPLA